MALVVTFNFAVQWSSLTHNRYFPRTLVDAETQRVVLNPITLYHSVKTHNESITYTLRYNKH